MMPLMRSLSDMVGLAAGEQVELTQCDAHTGDYRVWSIRLESERQGHEVLTLELHRQAPGYGRRLFPLLCLSAQTDPQSGAIMLQHASSDAELDAEALLAMVPRLWPVVGALKAQQRPQDQWLMPLCSKRGQILWQQTLRQGYGA